MPLMFLYVRYMTSESFQITPKALYHFLPSVVWCGVVIALITLTPAEIRQNIIGELDKESSYYIRIRQLFVFTNILIFLQVLIYSPVMLIQLVQHKRKLKKTYSFKEKISLNWLLVFISIFFSYYLFEFVVFISTDIPVNLTVYFLVITLHVFFVGIMGLKQREVYPKTSVYPDKVTKDIADVITSEHTKKQAIVSDEIKDVVAEKIRILMTENKLYLNPELSLYDLARELDIHKNYLSYIINDTFGVNFYTYINTFRIEEAKRMLTDSKYDNLSIEGIANSVGFKARNVFYPVFKKIVGQTPHEYKKGSKIK